jgi:hypothetical protein
MKTITAKLGSMRKAVEWVVYPPREDGLILIQCDKRICLFDPQTGEGRLSGSHNYPTVLTLNMTGSQAVIVPADVRAAALNAQPHKGDRLAGGVCIIG